MVSLKDIAKACDVSVTQVSRALNNHSDVSDKTKEKVHRVAKELGYIKNITAQRLVMKDSKQIAVIICGLEEDENEISNDFILETLKGINRFALTVDYEPIVHLVEKTDIAYEDFCKQRGIPGIILVGAKYDDPKFQQLIQSDFPCVVIDIPVEGHNKGCVVVNNYYYAMAAVKLMIEKGKKKIGLIGGTEHAMVNIERKIGYQAALTAKGIPYDEKLVVLADFNYDKACEQTKALFLQDSSIDGLFCASDIMAIGALKALGEIGKRVPEDVSLFGFDGIILTQFMHPPLATIKQDDVKKGYAAAKLLYEILYHQNTENTVVVPCEIIVRPSI